MEIVTAQLPGPKAEDRVFVSQSGLVILDGATAYEPSASSATEYVDHLGIDLSQRLDTNETLTEVLRSSIVETAGRLRLTPGTAPSSTVVLVRVSTESVQVLVLGDSTAVVGFHDGAQHVITDDRLNQLRLPEARTYRLRLAAGTGYDRQHADLLKQLQRRERAHRNRSGGFWIAEADPRAADHALSRTYDRNIVSWVIAATDGAIDPLHFRDIPWARIAYYSAEELRQELQRCAAWEAEVDPDGQALTRSKRHDDKTLAVIRLADPRE
ncbi:protein phosphatase 2C domain-containing protein [Nocardia gipuzkoensis]|uniref:protein phosphatase 2C domain-containing protein n=1 Tax=Nocardia TaxID=1817 RepID=UPI0024580780|nr:MULTISPECIES: protein phosphatase 2C domain-containing protein [Nocardia]